MVVLMMILAPSAMKAATMTIDFTAPTVAKQNVEWGNSGYSTNFQMSNNNYNRISGAKVGNRIDYQWSGDYSVNISRLAFVYNSSALTSTKDGSGFYLYGERIGNPWFRGLYTGQWNTQLAILHLAPGNKVTFTYSGSDRSGDNANLRNQRKVINGSGGWMTQVGKGQTATVTVDIDFSGDLIVSANQGTIIHSITIEYEVAEYKITTSDNSTSFEFTKSGTLEENDFAIPNLTASFGSINDHLVVQNLEAHMYKPDESEDLVTGGTNFQPSAGSFYAFRPTSNGTISVEGSLQGNQIHVFVYNPALGTVGDWDEKVTGNFYRDTFTSGTFSFNVAKDKIYYICQDNNNESGNALHLRKFTFTHEFKVEQLAKVIDLENDVINGWIQLTKIEGAGGYDIKVKRCSANISPAINTKIEHNYLYMSEPQFTANTDNAGTVIFDVTTDGGDVVFVATFPYHANFNDVENPDPYRTYGHTWNFIDPRNSDSNIGNCLIRSGIASFDPGTTTGILSIGRYEDTNSQFYHETQNREWTFSQRQTGSSGGGHDPYYMNVYDMEGDNANRIWETEGLWFETGTNLSCIYNENNAVEDPSKTNPLNFASPGSTDPDRYVGLLPDARGASSFTIPGLKDGDRVLIFMKSGEGSSANGIFLNISGAKDALGKPISASDLYKAGGTNWQHSRYEGCYHFIKDGDGNMKFDLKGGSMCKIMYIHIYTGERIPTTTITSQNSSESDNSKLLFINDKGAANGSASQLSLRFRGKGQYSTNSVLTYSGNLNANSFTGDNFKVSGKYNHLIDFTSKVGEIGMFRLRMTDIEYNSKYVADFNDRNFTVGYRDKVDSYPYTWDLTDIQGFSSDKMDAEHDYYPIAASNQDEYGDQWDISLFDENGNMKVNTGFDPESCNNIFDAHRIGYGNQLWAGGNVIPEARGLWFYSDDNNPLYNDCMQITSEGIRFANAPLPNVTDEDKNRKAMWNYKMVVPDVPQNGAVYLRMKRDNTVKDADNTNGTPFLATKFHFGTTDDANQKTSLSTNTEVINGTGNSNSKYSFYKVSGSNDEYIVAVKNTGAMNHLTFTLNGWIVEKVAVSTDSKKLNIRGWATESRDHVIDPELTAYLTGKDIETCLVTGVDYAAKTITLTRVYSSTNTTNPSLVMSSLANGDKGASILHNTAVTSLSADDGEVNILDGGFHLFVPDMHDYGFDMENKYIGQKSITDNSSMLVAQVSNSNGVRVIPAWSNGFYTNYALTYKYRKLNADGTPYGSTITGDEAFYRIAAGGASSSGNQGYLPLLTEYVDPHSSSYGTNPTNNAKFSIIFQEEFEVNSGIATQIENVESTGRVTTTEGFYNLNGQKINGIPTQKGMYIVNGKKVLVK
jgi:hypothetical protein